MASEIRVDKIINRSGLSTVTFSDTGAIVSGIVTANSFSGDITGNLTGTASANPVLTGSTNNTLVTVTGANAITGESNLTFDGSTLTVKGASNTTQAVFSGTGGSGSRGLEIVTESVGAADEGVILNARASGTTGRIKLQTNDKTAITILGNGGDVGIGTELPQSGGLTVVNDSEARLQLFANGDGSNGKIALRADGSNTQIGTWSDHDCKLVRNAVIQASIGSNGITFPAGKGIDFSATSDATGMTSELFDDYERGVHTISVTSSGTNPTVSISSNHNKLYYTKIGGMVHVTGELRWTISSHGSGDLRISIPFQSDSSSQSNSQGTAQTWNVNWAWRTESRDLWSEVSPGHNYMRFRIGGSNSLNEDYLQAGSSYQKTANSGYGVEYQVSLWYRTG